MYYNSLEAQAIKKMFLTANELKQDIQFYSINEPFFKDTDERVLFYTGLITWELLNPLTGESVCSIPLVTITFGKSECQRS